MEDAPFAAGDHRLGTSSETKRKSGKNNLGWVHARLLEYGLLQSVKFMYLHRPVAEIVHSVHHALHMAGNKSVLGAAKHGELVSEYVEFLFEEYAKISAVDNTTWAQAPYNWFERSVDSNDSNSTSSSRENSTRSSSDTSTSCMALVNGIVSFTGWSDCDIVEACTKLSTLKFPKLPADRSKFSRLEKLNTTLPIPFVGYV